MSDTELKAEKAMEKLRQYLADDLRRHNAIEMQAEQNFIGYIRLEADGRYSNEIIAWAVNQGVVYGASIEEVKQAAFERYGDYA